MVERRKKKERMKMSNNNFKPFVPAEKKLPEFTATSILLGILLAVLFGGANAYLGLRVGMTVSASIPAAVISNLILSIKFGGSVLDVVLNVVLGVVLCAMSTVFGMATGIRFPMLEWTNEIEPIKRSTSVAVYIFPAIFISMGLVVTVVFSNRLSPRISI